MAQRLAAAMALLAFAICLTIGGIQVGNTFSTTLSRALTAMAGTFVIGLVVGAMGQKMIEQNRPASQDGDAGNGEATGPAGQVHEKSQNPEAKPKAADR